MVNTETNASQPPHTVAGPIPTPNQPMPPEAHASEHVKVMELISKLNTTYQRQALVERLVPDANTKQQTVDELLSQRKAITRRILGTVENAADKSALIDLLDDYAEGVRRRRREARQRRDAATQKKTTATKELHLAHQNLSGILREPVPKQQRGEDKDAFQGRLNSYQKDYSQRKDTSSHQVGARTTDVNKAVSDATEAKYTLREAGDLHLLMAEIADNARGNHTEQRAKMQKQVSSLQKILRKWDIRDSNVSVTKEEHVAEQLHVLSEAINDPTLTPTDSMRAEFLSDYIQLRYRFEARRMATHGKASGVEYGASKGIIVDKGTESETEIFDDGSLANAGKRVYASGKAWKAPDLVAIGSFPQELDPEECFTDWEETRSPEDGAKATLAMREMVKMGRFEDSLRTKRLKPYMKKLQAKEQSLSRLEQTKAKLNQGYYNKATTRLTADISQLKEDSASALTRQKTARHELATRLYWLGFLEADPSTFLQDKPKGKLGVLGTKKDIIFSRRDQHASPPNLQEDGSIIWRGQLLYGIRSVWHIWPDGSANCYDSRIGKKIQLSPNGTLETE